MRADVPVHYKPSSTRSASARATLLSSPANGLKSPASVNSWRRLPDSTVPLPYSAYAPSPYFGATTMLSDVRPPPPRPPGLAALLAKTGDIELGREKGKELRHFSCWRLRWCAFCLVVASAMQASIVGSQLQLVFGSREGGMGPQLLAALILLALLLIAMWSLLSQLLLWSDSAVMKVPEGVRVREDDDE